MENQVPPANPVNQQPAYVTTDVVQQQSPQQPNKLQEFFLRFSLRQIFNVSSWTLLFLLAPFTVFVLISQNAVPGDAFYPLKRRLEDVVLVAAAAHPATRVAFRTNLTKRRFGEAETLLLARLDTEGLDNFVEEVQAARNEAENIADPVKKEELVKQLNNSLTEYAQRLTTVRQQVSSRTKPPQLQPVPPTETPQATTPTSTPHPVPTTQGGQTPKPTNTLVPTLPPAGAGPTNVPPVDTPTPQPTIPEATPTVVPTPPSPSNPTDKIDQTLDYLTCLKRKSASECTPPARSRSVREEREERREAREERREEQREEKRERKGEQEERKEMQKEQGEERREKENRREKSP